MNGEVFRTGAAIDPASAGAGAMMADPLQWVHGWLP
jgi:hypothetical protein